MGFFFLGCSTHHAGPVSDHFDGRAFFNPSGIAPKSLWDVLKWQWTKEAQPWPASVENKAKPSPAGTVAPGTAVVTFVNHATMLVQLAGLNVLTDPVLSERASPFSFLGPKRVRPPGLAFDELPKIDVVVVSHNHYDHLDVTTLERLNQRDHPLFLVPLGDRRLLESFPGVRVQEMDWGQAVDEKGTRITFQPSQHWSARGAFDRNLSLWGSYVLEGPGFTVYFAGDTGYGDHFARTGRRFRIDLALLPIGAYEPRWFMKDQHMNPEEAVRAHRDLGARRSIGLHFGTFQLTDEAIDQPAKDLLEAVRTSALDPNAFIVLDQGETRMF